MENLNAYVCLWIERGIWIPGRDTELSANVELCNVEICGSLKEGQIPERNATWAELATRGKAGRSGHLREA